MRPVDIYDSAAYRARAVWNRVRPKGKTSKVKSIPAAQAKTVGRGELTQRHGQLARQLAELQWDLGGLVYEMAIRDHFRLDVVVAQAARLQAVDAELGAVERMVLMEDAGAAGACPACGALYARGAVFCWQCGHDLVQRAAVAAAPQQPAAHAAPQQPTAEAPQEPTADAPATPEPETIPDAAMEQAPVGTRWPGQ